MQLPMDHPDNPTEGLPKWSSVMFHHEEAPAATEPKEGKPVERSRPKPSFDVIANAISSASKTPRARVFARELNGLKPYHTRS